jgi:hypothetical protein
MRIAVTGVFGDRPTVLPRQVSQQAEDQLPSSAAGLHPRKPGGHPLEQPVGLGVPPPGIYAMARSHRLII